MCHDGIQESGSIVPYFFTLTVGASEPNWTLLRRKKLLMLSEIQKLNDSAVVLHVAYQDIVICFPCPFFSLRNFLSPRV
jgi:hypothetical protein